MDFFPESVITPNRINNRTTVACLGKPVLILLACLFTLVRYPANAQAIDRPVAALQETPTAVNPGPVPANPSPAPSVRQVPSVPNSTPASSVPAAVPPVTVPTTPSAVSSTPDPVTSAPAPVYPPRAPGVYYRRRPVAAYAAEAAPAGVTSAAPIAQNQDPRFDRLSVELERELDLVRDELRQSQANLRQASRTEGRLLIASVIFLAVFGLIAAVLLIRLSRQARTWDENVQRAAAEIESVRAEVSQLRGVQEQARNALPALLKEAGESSLNFQEEGAAFSPGMQVVLDQIDFLAYVGPGKLAFQDLTSESDVAVYLNGLLLSAVSHLSRLDPWTAYARLGEFFSRLARFPNAVERRRVAQAHSYRALAGYQVLESQRKEPSWLRRGERTQLETLLREAFADVSHAAAIDPAWRHTVMVEALLCSRYSVADIDSDPRGELLLRGLRRAASLYQELIAEDAYRGPARRQLLRCLKQIAEHTGDKGDFSDFAYALNGLPSDEELAGEALAARQPASQDRFLWQWLISDEFLFAGLERLNLAEYRTFWVRTLDAKVNLRDWRSDLAELEESRPAMKEWTVKLLQSDAPLALPTTLSRRQER
jgi:hypothetical protein